MITLYLLTILPILNACRSESTVLESESVSVLGKPTISIKKLSEVPEASRLVNKIKTEHSANFLNKSIEEFEVDEDNVIEVDLQEQGKIVSMVVQQPVLELNYSVINLNITTYNGIESYFLTKYIPSNGQPFYSYYSFEGIIQVLDLSGNIISSTASTGKQYAINIGCIGFVFNDNVDGYWQVQSMTDICGSSGGSGTGGNGGNQTGSYGGTTGGSNGGYVPTTGGGIGSGGTGGTPTQPSLPNIPSEDVVDQKRFKIFLTSSLTTQEVDILIANQRLSNEIFNYQKSKDFSSASKNNSKWFMNFFGQTKDAEPFSIFNFGTKFIDENTDIVNPNNVFLRVYALDKFVKQNPDGLLDMPC